MEKENKELLLKDLCARLPYGVKISIKSKYQNEMEVETLNGYHLFEKSYNLEDRNMKPYLRPLTDITDEEIMERLVSKYGKGSDEVDGFIEFKKLIYNTQCIVDVKFARYKDTIDETRYFISFSIDGYNASYNDIDWLNEHHFDYRGLIRKGLALEAPKDMYNTKK